MRIRKHFDAWTLLVMAVTLLLFLTALVTTGFKHDLLLEAGVFLVSVKLIGMGYSSSVSSKSMERKLDEIQLAVQQLGRAPSHDGALQQTGPPREGSASSAASAVPGGPARAPGPP